jgi:predicted transcriptional regulator
MMMAENLDKGHLSVRTPAHMIEQLDVIAEFLERERTWVVLRALSLYLAGEGGSILQDIEGMAALKRGERVDFDEAMDDLDRLVDNVARKSKRA